MHCINKTLMVESCCRLLPKNILVEKLERIWLICTIDYMDETFWLIIYAGIIFRIVHYAGICQQIVPYSGKFSETYHSQALSEINFWKLCAISNL